LTLGNFFCKFIILFLWSGKLPDSLRSETIRALAGADLVREQLLSVLALGPTPFNQRVYAIKCRIKSEERLIEKVLNRRRKGKPRYSAFDATDIIGLRILVLFSEDLPVAVSEFIRLVQLCQGPNISLFAGASLADCLKEAIIYSSSTQTKAYELVYDSLRALNLPPDKQGQDRVRMIKSSLSEPYSSIHLVLIANSFHAHTAKKIPIEVQIRTAFEDLWAEIDHPRSYKGPDFSEYHEEDSATQKIAKNIPTRLENLKGHLERCSLDADLIKIDFDALTNFTQPKVQHSYRHTDLPVCSAKAPAEIRSQAKAIEGQISTFHKENFGWSGPHSDLSYEMYSAFSVSASRDLGRLRSEYEILDPEGCKRDREFAYYAAIELGSLQYWCARLIRGSQSHDAAKVLEHGNTALENFYSAQGMSGKHFDCLINYKLGLTLMLMGHNDIAIDKLRRATAEIDEDPDLDAQSPFRCVIPRQLGYALWLRSDQLRKFEGSSQSTSMSREVELLIREAAETTVTTLKRLASSPDSPLNRDNREKKIYCNNSLYFYQELCELRSEQFKDLSGETQEDLIEAYNYLSKSDNPTTSNLDTLVKASSFLNRYDDEVKFLAQLVAAMKMGGGKGLTAQQLARIDETILSSTKRTRQLSKDTGRRQSQKKSRTSTKGGRKDPGKSPKGSGKGQSNPGKR
jgi:ppGpp synthetase/RelA/SpoT-type nucleotidyltranferase